VVSPAATVDIASARRQALAVVAGQTAVAALGALVCLMAIDRRAALSALIGGGIGAAATLVQALVSLRDSAGRTPQAVVRGFYRGSALKLVSTVVLFVMALRIRPLAPGPLFLTYVATFLVYWVALARTFRTGVAQDVSTGMEHRDRDGR
jgi:ATP synthase protein I